MSSSVILFLSSAYLWIWDFLVVDKYERFILNHITFEHNKDTLPLKIVEVKLIRIWSLFRKFKHGCFTKLSKIIKIMKFLYLMTPKKTQ